MIWLLDTNIVIRLCNRDPSGHRVIRRMSGRSPGDVRMSAITLAELEFGIENSDAPDLNRLALSNVLGIIQVDDFPAQAARDYAEIKATLRRKGRPTQPYDLLIGAHARSLGATLVTDDTNDFKHMPGLHLVNWLKT